MTIRPVRFASALPAALCAALAAAPALAADPSDPPFHRHLRSPARLGLEVQGMTPELRGFFKAPPDAGVLISEVEPGSPAAEAGLVVGDVLVEAGGEKVESARDLVWKAMRAPEGEPLALVVIHEGAEKKLDVVPRGEPQPPFWDREELFGPGQADAIRELREALQKIERRLEDLENRMAKPEKRT